jgi:hypothetical protein
MTSWISTELQTQHSNIYDEKKYEDYEQLGHSNIYDEKKYEDYGQLGDFWNVTLDKKTMMFNNGTNQFRLNR